jgi:putative hemolysin
VRPQGKLTTTRPVVLDRSDSGGTNLFAEFAEASRVVWHLVWVSEYARCPVADDFTLFFPSAVQSLLLRRYFMVAVELIVITILILLNGLLAMSEMAVVSSKKSRLRKMSDDGNRGAKSALKLSESENNDFLASIQVGITLIGVLAGAFSGATLSDKISNALDAFDPRLTPYSDAMGLGVVVIFVTYFSLILGELVPKRLALNNPESIASRVAVFISVLGKVLRPLVYLLSLSTKFVLKLLRANQVSDKTVTEEEVKILIEEGTEAGVFDKQEETMMKRVLKLDDYKVLDLMTPRMKVVGIDIHDSIEDTLAKVIQHSHSYFPVFSDSMDHPIGLLSVKTILAKMVKKECIDFRECMSEALFMPKSLPADDALEKFRQSGKHIAFAVDEYGGFAGVITVYDITESIVGEIPNNNQDIDRKIVRRDNGSLLVEGHMSFQELSEHLKLHNDSDEDFQTIGGFMMAKLGRIPTEGDSIEMSPYRFEVVDMDRHRVDKVLIEKIGQN